MAPADMFWGDRYAMARDPFGHSWAMAMRVEDLTLAERNERAKKAMGGPAPT
jgi:hypothetical protein